MKLIPFCLLFALYSCQGPEKESTKTSPPTKAQSDTITPVTQTDSIPSLRKGPLTDLEKVKPFLDEWYRQKIKEYDYPWDEYLKEHPDHKKPDPRNALVTDSTIEYPELMPVCCIPNIDIKFKKDLNRDGKADLILGGSYLGGGGFSANYWEDFVFLGTDSGYRFIGSLSKESLGPIVGEDVGMYATGVDRKGNLDVNVMFYGENGGPYPPWERDVKFSVSESGLKVLKLGKVKKSPFYIEAE